MVHGAWRNSYRNARFREAAGYEEPTGGMQCMPRNDFGLERNGSHLTDSRTKDS